jgi:hypothetical protein
MNAIYAYKEFPNHYKPLNDDFYELAKLSIISAKRFYKTVLYCDEETNRKFIENKLFFDEVVILKKIEDYSGRLYCIPKIFAMLEQNEPYIMLDFDSVIMEPITSNHSIAYGYYEVNLLNTSNDDVIDWYYQSYVMPFRLYIKEYFTGRELSLFDWSKVPNFSLMLINNPHTIKHIFDTIIERIPLHVMEKCTPTLIEQFLCYQFLTILNVDNGPLINQMYLEDLEKVKFIDQNFLYKKYTHININDSNIKEILELLRNILQKKFI